jgi:hypothetical protein
MMMNGALKKMCQHTCNNTIIPEGNTDADYDNEQNDGPSTRPHIMIMTMIMLLFLFCAAGEDDYTVQEQLTVVT